MAQERDAAPGAPHRTGRWRPVVSTLLVVLASLLAPLAVVALWAEDQVGETDRYVATITPLADDPALQDSVSGFVTTEVMDRLEIAGVARDAAAALSDRGLPPRLEASLTSLAVPLETQVRSFVEERVERFIRSDEFAQAWIEANRAAHGRMVAVLTGQGDDVVDTAGGAVRVNLAAVIEAVKQRLVDEGFELAAAIPEVEAQFTVLESVDLTRAQTGFRLLGAVSAVLPWLALVALAGAVLVSRSPRRALVAGSLAVAGSMVLLGLGLGLARLVYLDAVPTDQLTPAAAASVFDALVHFIRVSLRAVLVLLLVVALVAWVTGPGPQPTAVRRVAGRGVAGVRRGTTRAGLDTGRLGVVLHDYRTPIRVTVAAVALLTFVMADHPTGRFTALVAGTALLVLLVVEVLARPAPGGTGGV